MKPTPWAKDIDQVEQDLAELLERGWYTNNGPLLQKLEKELAIWLGLPWAVGLSTEEAGVYLCAAVHAPEGGFSAGSGISPLWPGIMQWAGRAQVADGPLWLGVELAEAEAARARGAFVVVDATPALSNPALLKQCSIQADALIVSMRSGSLLDAGEGGLVAGRDPLLWNRLRTARNHHASEVFAAVPIHFNFKMSEAQALLGLRSLDLLRAR
jgi:dTDP-4-amino-4,6-dideoxygalactose transaminase